MKTTLRKIISEIDFSDKRLESQIDWEELGSIFNINGLYWSEDTRLKAYFIKVHNCTDTWVGTRAYFLDNELIAISYQSYRKSDEDFEFVTLDKVELMKSYLLSLLGEDTKPLVDIIDNLDSEIDDTYSIVYNTEILHTKAIYNDEEVDIVKKDFRSEGIKSKNYFHSVEIKLPNKENIIVDVEDLKFKYNTL